MRSLLPLVFLCAVATAQDASVPQSNGTFYKAGNSWTELHQVVMSGGGTKHAAKMFVPGLTPQMVWTFRGAEAPVQIEDRRPTFYVKQIPALDRIAGHSERDLSIIRFDKKKDHRELQTTNGGNMFTLKAGIGKDRLPDLTAKKLADGLFSVTPNGDLKPGEYMLTFSAMGNTGYDFGIK